jgi:hypothetical protein
MSSKRELLETFQRILWAENQMRSSYSSYTDLADRDMQKTIQAIEADEIRHANMVEQIISILKK